MDIIEQLFSLEEERTAPVALDEEVFNKEITELLVVGEKRQKQAIEDISWIGHTLGFSLVPMTGTERGVKLIVGCFCLRRLCTGNVVGRSVDAAVQHEINHRTQEGEKVNKDVKAQIRTEFLTHRDAALARIGDEKESAEDVAADIQARVTNARCSWKCVGDKCKKHYHTSDKLREHMRTCPKTKDTFVEVCMATARQNRLSEAAKAPPAYQAAKKRDPRVAVVSDEEEEDWVPRSKTGARSDATSPAATGESPRRSTRERHAPSRPDFLVGEAAEGRDDA